MMITSEMITYKTGVLSAASFEMGALIAGGQKRRCRTSF